MKRNRCGLLMCATALFTLISLSGSLPAADPPVAPAAKPPDKAELEKRFSELLTGATLVGHYTEGEVDPKKPLPEDRYTINELTKQEGDMWLFKAHVKVEGFDVTLPIPLKVLWAGDTPVITLDDVALPGLGTFSARVLFHGHQYAGTWSGGGHSGQLFGRIERGEGQGKEREVNHELVVPTLVRANSIFNCAD